MKIEGKTYHLVKGGHCSDCAFYNDEILCGKAGVACMRLRCRLVWRETFLSRLRRWWVHFVETQIIGPDPYDDESVAATRYAIQQELAAMEAIGPSRARIAEKAREAADVLQGVPL